MANDANVDMLKTFKNLSSRTKSPMTLKLDMQHLGHKLYKVYINDDPELIVTYFTTRSNFVSYVFEWGKLLQSHSIGKICHKWPIF